MQIELLLQILCIIAVTFTVFILINAYAHIRRQKLERETTALQESYYAKWYEDMKQSYSDMQSFQHDVNNQLTVLQGMILSQMAVTSENKRTFENIQSTFSKLRQFEPTHNLVVDTLLQNKWQRAKTYDITIECDIAVPSDIEFDSLNFVSIFGNLLDNAIEAVKDIPEESEKIIFFKLRYNLPNLIFLIRNPYCGNLNINEKEGDLEFHSTKINVCSNEVHGIGLKNVKKSVEKYQGILNITTENHQFEVGGILMNYGEKP
jgi:sensor histidine kinase regulating citrate/malate metabolism